MKVLIVGAGNIGRRHMQALAGVPEITGVNVADPSTKCLKIAKKMALDEERAGRGINVHFHTTIPECTNDLTIIATNANERRAVWDKVRDRSGFVILEKFLFNKVDEYDAPRHDKKRTFVNCSRRAMPCYDSFLGQEKVTIYYYGLDGLLCNAIHFIDLMCYLTGSPLAGIDVQISKAYKSKRRGYWDADGKIIATTEGVKGMCYLTTTAMSKKKQGPLYIVNDAQIDESGMTAKGADGVISAFKFELQSKMTGRIAVDLMKRGTCGLPDYWTSAEVHMMFLEQLRRIGWKNPIT